MRSMLNDVYFGKTRQIVSELRSTEGYTEIKKREEVVDDIKKAVYSSSKHKNEL